MLAFLHSAAVHVPNFTRIVRDLDPATPTRHALREDLFAQALADGRVTESTRAGTRAASLGRPILLVAATATAMATAVNLPRETSERTSSSLSFRELMCGAAWRRFQAGDQAGYAAAIAREVEERAEPNEVVMLAQASMAPAAALVGRSDIEVLTSPDVGVRATLALLR